MRLVTVGLVGVLLAGGAASLSGQAAVAGTPAASPPDSSLMTPASLDAGRKIFHGKGSCFACHGGKLEGGPVAPSLRGTSWRHIDGSYQAIRHRIETGLSGTAMVSRPGGISDAEVAQVAAYIYAVSHGLSKP